MADALEADQKKLLNRIVIEGKLFKLVPGSIKCKRDLINWEGLLLGSFDGKDRRIIKNHKFMWNLDDEMFNSVDYPEFGIPTTVLELVALIKKGQLARKRVEEITDDQWTKVKNLTRFDLEDVTQTALAKTTVIHAATPNDVKKTLDKIVKYLSGKLHEGETVAGQATANYFEKGKEYRIAMEGFIAKAVNYILDRDIEGFRKGRFKSWSLLMDKTRRFFGYEDSENDHEIAEIFDKMKIIATDRKKSMEDKVQDMKTELEKWMISDPDNVFETSDFPGDDVIWTQGEQFTPLVATLCHCLIYAVGHLSKQKWNNMFNEFFNRMQSDKTYKQWHMNRFKLYEIIDKESKSEPRGQNMLHCNDSDQSNKSIDPENDEMQAAISANRNWPKNKGQGRNNNTNQRGRFQNFGGRGNGNNSSNQNQRWGNNNHSNAQSRRGNRASSGNQGSARGNSKYSKGICAHCTHHAGKEVRHEPPYKGRAKCLFDLKGNLRKARSIAMVDYQNQDMRGNNESLLDEGNRNYELEFTTQGAVNDHCNERNEEEGLTYYEDEEAIYVNAIEEDGFVGVNGEPVMGVGSGADYEENEGGAVRIASPSLDCTFRNPKIKDQKYSKGRIVLDSGAANSMIHADRLRECQYKVSGPRVKQYKGAGGTILELKDVVVDVVVEIAGRGMFCLKDVLVSEAKDATVKYQVLMGRADINRFKVALDFGAQRLKFGVGHLKDQWIPMKVVLVEHIATVETESRKSSTEKVFKEVLAWKSKEDPEGIQDKHCNDDDNDSISPEDGDYCRVDIESGSEWCKGCSICISEKWKTEMETEHEKPNILDNPNLDVRTYMLAYIGRLRQRDREKNTVHECTIGDEIRCNEPDLYKKILELLDEYKDVFSGEIGNVGEKYAVKAEMTSKPSDRRPGHQKFQGTTLVAIMKQLARQVAHGVLVEVNEAGITPKNHMQILPVRKKDDDGNIVEMLSNTRVVLNSVNQNKFTQFTPSETDSLEDSIQFAAKTSKKGYNLKADISDAYWAIPMDKVMWAWFCVVIPFMGIYCYTKMVQGWAPSAQYCQDVFTKIFFPLFRWMKRYMDDVIIATDGDEKDYLAKIRMFLNLCRQNGLRLKGKKCFFGVKKFNYLGYKIEDGKITASVHYKKKINDIAMESILTKNQLKSFVYMVAFLARFLFRSGEVLKPLRDASNGEGKEKLVWTEPLKKAFHRAKDAMKELTATHPFDPELPTIMVVDTSLLATGGFLYQVSEEGPKIIAFFSRTRKSRERAIPLSSCHFETFGMVSGVTAFIAMLRQCKLPVTIVVDSKPLVQAFQRLKNFAYSEDTKLNNALYKVLSIVDVNIVHSGNTSPKIKLADLISRLGEFKNDKGCVGSPQCTICKAAQFDDNDKIKTIAMIESWCNTGSNHGNLLTPAAEDGMEIKDSEMFAITKSDFKKNELKLFQQKHTVTTFKKDYELIAMHQKRDSNFRRLLEDIPLGVVSYAKKKAKLGTMLLNRKASVENGILYLMRNIDGIEYKVIPLPDSIAMTAVAAVHKTIGHQSMLQLHRHLQRHFDIAKPKEKIQKLVSKCIKCALMKGTKNLKKIKMDPVPLPKDLFRTVLADEVTRNIRNTNVRFVIAMEGVSQFVTVVVYTGAMTGEKFVSIMSHIKSILCPHNQDCVKITLRCDQAKWHGSPMVKEALRMMNVEISFYSSTTFSKNVIPELDVKIRNFSKYQLQILEDEAVSMEQSCHLAAIKCNNAIGQLGRTPAEVFTGRGWESEKTVQIDVEKILKDIAMRRERRRQDEERKRLRDIAKKEAKFVPYKNGSLNSALVRNPGLTRLKEGDSVTLFEKFDKNEPKSAWVVKQVNAQKQKVLLQKDSGLNIKDSIPKWIDFAMVDDIFEEENALYDLSTTQDFHSKKLQERARHESFQKFLFHASAMTSTLRTNTLEGLDESWSSVELSRNEAEPDETKPEMKGEYEEPVWVDIDMENTKFEETKLEETKLEETKLEETEENQHCNEKVEQAEQRPRSTRQSARAGQKAGAFSGMCK